MNVIIKILVQYVGRSSSTEHKKGSHVIFFITDCALFLNSSFSVRTLKHRIHPQSKEMRLPSMLKAPICVRAVVLKASARAPTLDALGIRTSLNMATVVI